MPAADWRDRGDAPVPLGTPDDDALEGGRPLYAEDARERLLALGGMAAIYLAEFLKQHGAGLKRRCWCARCVPYPVHAGARYAQRAVPREAKPPDFCASCALACV